MMSSLLVIQNNDNVLMVADTALSANIDGRQYRVNDNYEKIYYHNKFCIFVSGKTKLVEHINEKIINIKDNLLNELPLILKNISYDTYDIEIVISKLNKNSSEVHFFSSYNDFKHEVSIVDKNESSLFSAGIKTNEVINEFLNNYDTSNIKSSLISTYNNIQDETVGGNITIFNLKNESKNKLKLNDVPLNRLSLKNTHLLVAERVVGKLLIGQKLLIRDDDGTMILNGSLQTIKDRSDNVKVQLGEYNPNQFGLQVYDGAVNIRTKGTTGNTGLILDINGLRSYDNSGREMFNLNSITGSATFSGNLNGANGTFNGNLSAVGGTFTGTLQGVDGTFTGTLNGNSIIGASITGGTITGTKFMTYDTSNEGQITISGSTFKSTNYSDDNHYVEISNGGLLIHTYGNDTGTYQTVDISGNYGIRIYSDMYPNSSLRMDVYETNSAQGTQVYKLHASGYNADLLVLSDNQLRIKGNSINLEPYSYEGATINGRPIAVKEDIYSALNGYWSKGSDTGYLSNSVYIGSASIGVGGGYEGSTNATHVNMGSSNIYLPGTVYAGGSALTSDRDKKKNIIPYEKEVLSEMNSTQIYTYNLKTELDGELPHLGIILQEAPIDVIDPSGGVEIYAMVSFAWKAIQELYNGLQGVSCQLNK